MCDATKTDIEMDDPGFCCEMDNRRLAKPVLAAPGSARQLQSCFLDDFNRPNEDLGDSPDWTEVSPGMSIEGNEVRASTRFPLNTYTATPSPFYARIKRVVIDRFLGAPVIRLGAGGSAAPFVVPQDSI